MKISKLLICTAFAGVLSATAMDADNTTFNPAQESTSVQSAWNNIGAHEQHVKPVLDRISTVFPQGSEHREPAILKTIKRFKANLRGKSLESVQRWCADLAQAPASVFAGLKSAKELSFVLKHPELRSYESNFDARLFKNICQSHGFEANFRAIVEPLGSYGYSLVHDLYVLTGMDKEGHPDMAHVQILFDVASHRWSKVGFAHVLQVLGNHHKDYQLPVGYMLKTLRLLDQVMIATPQISSITSQETILETIFSNQSETIIPQILEAIQKPFFSKELGALKAKGREFGLLQQRKSEVQAIEARKKEIAKSEATLGENEGYLLGNSGKESGLLGVLKKMGVRVVNMDDMPEGLSGLFGGGRSSDEAGAHGIDMDDVLLMAALSARQGSGGGFGGLFRGFGGFGSGRSAPETSSSTAGSTAAQTGSDRTSPDTYVNPDQDITRKEPQSAPEERGSSSDGDIERQQETWGSRLFEGALNEEGASPEEHQSEPDE